MSIETLKFVLAAAEQMKEQSDRCTRLVRPAMFPINIVGQKHGLHLLGFVILIEKFAQAAGQKRNQLRNLATGDPAKPLADTKQIAPTL